MSSLHGCGLCQGLAPLRCHQRLPQVSSLPFLSSFCWETFKTTSIWINVGRKMPGDSSDCFIKIQGTNWAVLNCVHMDIPTYFEQQTLIHKLSVSVTRNSVFAGQDLLFVNPCCLFGLLTSECLNSPKPMEGHPLPLNLFRSGYLEKNVWNIYSEIKSIPTSETHSLDNLLWSKRLLVLWKSTQKLQ